MATRTAKNRGTSLSTALITDSPPVSCSGQHKRFIASGLTDLRSLTMPSWSVLNHDPVFERFHPVAPVTPGEGLAIDSLLGTALRTEYNLTWQGPPTYPPPLDEEYFEWVDLLTAATRA